MSHEIRTPMNAILGFTDILLESESDPIKLDNLKIIKSSGKNLLNDILDFSKIEAGKIEIQKENFSFSRMIENLIGMFQVLAGEKNIEFDVKVDSSVPAVVFGDEHRITQILLNILGNAFKFTRQGSVDLECRYEDLFVIITMEDTGIGVSKEKTDYIFNPFEQGDSSLGRRYGGTGLGLSISRKLAQLMDGSITVESEEGEGSVFTITLRLPPGHTDSEEKIEGGFLIGYSATDLLHEEAGYTSEEMVKNWLSAMDGDKNMEKILLEGIAEIPEKISRLEDAVLRNIKNDIKFIAHDIKGFTGNLGMKEVATLASEIYEEVSKEGYKPERVRELFYRLKRVTESIPEKYLRMERELKPDVSKIQKGFRVLVAEDNVVNQKLVQALLKKIGVNRDMVDNGRKALEILDKKSTIFFF